MKQNWNEATLWPKASDSELKGGWLLSVPFLEAIARAVELFGERVSLEQVEGVLLAAQAYALHNLDASIHINGT